MSGTTSSATGAPKTSERFPQIGEVTKRKDIQGRKVVVATGGIESCPEEKIDTLSRKVLDEKKQVTRVLELSKKKGEKINSEDETSSGDERDAVRAQSG